MEMWTGNNSTNCWRKSKHFFSLYFFVFIFVFIFVCLHVDLYNMVKFLLNTRMIN